MIVEAIYTCGAAGEPVREVPRARLLRELGIEGDRYATGAGSFSRWPKPGRDISLVAAEDLDRLRELHGHDLSGGLHRRNIVVRGGDLRALVEAKFRIGGAVLQGVRPCLPCMHLEKKLARPGLKAALASVAPGLRADVEVEGWIAAGDEVVPLGDRLER